MGRADVARVGRLEGFHAPSLQIAAALHGIRHGLLNLAEVAGYDFFQ